MTNLESAKAAVRDIFDKYAEAMIGGDRAGNTGVVSELAMGVRD